MREHKKERLETRISPEQKKLFVRAANLGGRTLTDFVTTSLQESAIRIIRESELIRLTENDSKFFIDALLNPSKPSSRLKKAVTHYRSKNA